jgi:twitching motility protein PilT
MDIDQLLADAIGRNASDLHLSVGLSPKVRVDGEIRNLSDLPLKQTELEDVAQHILSSSDYQAFEKTLEYDGAYEVEGLSRFRVNLFCQQRGLGAVFRVVPYSIPSLDALEFSSIFKELSGLSEGLVLVTGPTGCGKSTTLASMIDYINKNRQKHVITIEDPIEFIHTSNQCLINQREIHNSTKSFNSALRSALREDPDIILIGEMRDLETIRLVLRAAETGHLVFSTVHTSTAARTINRIIDVFPGDEKNLIRSMLSESLKGVISQKLLPLKTGGRVAAHEIMVNTTAIMNMIREDKIPQIYSAIQTGKTFGMQTMAQATEELMCKNLINAVILDD